MLHINSTLTYLLLNLAMAQFVIVASVSAGGDFSRIEVTSGDVTIRGPPFGHGMITEVGGALL